MRAKGKKMEETTFLQARNCKSCKRRGRVLRKLRKRFSYVDVYHLSPRKTEKIFITGEVLVHVNFAHWIANKSIKLKRNEEIHYKHQVSHRGVYRKFAQWPNDKCSYLQSVHSVLFPLMGTEVNNNYYNFEVSKLKVKMRDVFLLVKQHNV